MNVIFKKSQLRLVEDEITSTVNNNKPALSQTNTERDNDSSSAQNDYSNLQQKNTGNYPINVDTQSYLNTPVLQQNKDKIVTLPRNASTGSEISRILQDPSTAPGSIRVENRSVKEGITFSKKELDAFLNSL